jgi:phage antirepressor YoqD-like protein
MNLIATATPSKTMTSRQIATVVNSRHDSVKRTIERLATTHLNTDGSLKTQAVIVRPPMVDEQSVDAMGRNRTESIYVINERDSYIVVAQLCPAETAKLVDYWMATKNQTPAIPQTLPDALRLAADLAEQKAIVEQQLTIAAPKAQAFDNMINVAGGLSFRTLAKDLNVNESVLRAFLKKKKWMQWIKGNMVTMERAERKGWAKTDSVPVTDLDEHGNVKKEYMKVTTLFTGAGKAALELAIVEGELQRKSKGSK